MNPFDLPTACSCGCENFQRVVVERVAGKPITTDFLACVECACMYHAPLPTPSAPLATSPEPRPRLPHGHGLGSLTEAPFVPEGWIDPADSLKKFKADVEVAAADYVKPGRHPKIGDKRRR